MTSALHLTGDTEADQLLAQNPLALLLGSLLDQQVAMEMAFVGPKKLAERLGHLDVWRIAEIPVEDFTAVCAQKPAVHRFPGAMAKRIQSLCRFLGENYDGDAAGIWTEGEPDGAEVLRRLRQLPGFGQQKAQIFVALLGKQLDVRPHGWAEAAGDYGADGARLSIADVTDEQTLQEVRQAKRQAKQT